MTRIRWSFVLFVLVIAAAFPSTSGSSVAVESRTAAWCNGSQSWTSVHGSIGDLVRVKARVASAYFARSPRGQPTFLDLGRAYPNPSRIKIVIWGSDRVNFPRAPERMFRAGQLVCAQGVPSLYRGAVQIEIAVWDAESRLMSF